MFDELIYSLFQLITSIFFTTFDVSFQIFVHLWNEIRNLFILAAECDCFSYPFYLFKLFPFSMFFDS